MLNIIGAKQKLLVKQVFEMGEIFGFETRNKYRVTDETGVDFAFIAEQQKGFLYSIFRQFLGHWRSFDLHFFDSQRVKVLSARHPFRWFFQRLELADSNGREIGVIEREFSILSKRFKVLDANHRLIFEISSPIWRLWTFSFLYQGRERARVSKKWTGLFAELLTDKDSFLIEFKDERLSIDERALILAASIFIDLMYFERKGAGGGAGGFFD